MVGPGEVIPKGGGSGHGPSRSVTVATATGLFLYKSTGSHWLLLHVTQHHRLGSRLQ